MLRTTAVLCCVIGLATAADAQVNASQIQWGPAPPNLPAGAQAAVLSGDPGKAGIFVIRVRMPAGYKVPPHSHPTDEDVTVLSGDLTYGMGDTIDMSKGPALTAGGFFRAEAGMHHYVFSKTGAELQISAQGPFAITYVNPADDPSPH